MSAPSEFGKRHVVSVGVNAYTAGIAPLRSARPDAESVASILVDHHQYDPLAISLDENASGEQLRALFQSLPDRVGPADQLLVYFAGHGIARGDEEAGPQGYLIPHDATPQEEASWISMQWLREALDKLPCRHLLVILDCCFAGSFRWASSRDFAVAPHRLYHSQYERFLRGTAWQVLTSATQDERASDITPWKGNFRDTGARHSPFAEALLRGLSGDADAARGASTGDGVITASDLYLFIYQVFHEKSLGSELRQTPGIWPLNRRNNAEFVFHNPKHPLDVDPDPPLNDAQNPWRGLQAYTEEDKLLFFGRERVARQLLEQLNQVNSLVVLGASGTGKSSVVRAGLLPLLRERKQPVVGPFRPGEKPLEILKTVDSTAVTSSLLVVDQLEEVYTQCRDPQEREAFLTGLANRIDGGLRVLVTLRSDFEPRFVASPHWSRLCAGRYLLPPFSLNEYRSVIQGPAIARALFFDPADIEDRLVNEILAMPGGLPLLSFALSEMYRQSVLRRRHSGATDRSLTEEDYQAAGGVIGALHTRADALFEAASPPERFTIRRLFLRLLSIESGHRVRRTVSDNELDLDDPSEQQQLTKVLEAFTETRLLVASERGVEASHDTLLQAWGRLDEWLDEDIESAIAQQRIWQAAVVWHSGGRDRELLWPDYPRLPWFVDREQRKRLNRLELAFLAASEDRRLERIRELEYERDRAQDSILMNAARRDISNPTRVVQFLREIRYFDQARDWYRMALDAFARPIAWMTLGDVSARVGFSDDGRRFVASRADGIVQIFQPGVVRDPVLLHHQGKSSRPSFALSHDGRQIVTASLDEAYPEAKVWGTNRRSKPIALSGHEARLHNPAFSADDRWIYMTSEHWVSRLWRPNGRRSLLLSGRRDVPIYSAAFSPDGRWIASTTADEMVRLHSADGSGEVVLLEGHESLVRSVDFSVDGSSLVSASMDGTARVWQLNHPGQSVILKGHGGWVACAAFSPDSRKVVTASDDIARVWNADGSGNVTEIEDKDLKSAVFSPDGTAVLTASREGSARIWPLGRGAAPITFQASDPLNAAIFSPDGRHVVTASGDGSIRRQRTDGRGEVLVLEAQSAVNSLAFSPDGESLLTGHDDGTVCIWPASGHAEPRKLRGHTAGVCTAVFSPDGRQIVSAARDGTARVWRADGSGRSQIFLDYRGEASRAIFSPDGKWVLLSSIFQSDIQLRRLNGGTRHIPIEGTLERGVFSPDGRMLATLMRDGNAISVRRLAAPLKFRSLLIPSKTRVTSFAFSSDGSRIIAALADGTARVWLADGREDPIIFRLHRKIVNSAAFSPDGDWIVTASKDGNVGIQRSDRSGKPQHLAGESEVTAASFSSDGERILSLSKDGTARVWSRENSGDPVVLEHVDGEISEASFSPDGRWVATTSSNSVRLWDTQRSTESRLLKGHRREISFAAFSRDGHFVLTIAYDKTARLWPVDPPGNPVVLDAGRSWFDKVEVSSDGQHVLTISDNRQVKLWPMNGRAVSRALKARRHGFQFATFTADSRSVITRDWGSGPVRLWPLDEHEEPRTLAAAADSIAISPDGSKLVAERSGDLRVLDIAGHEEPRELDTQEVGNDRIREIRFSPDGRWVVAGSHHGMPRLWQANGRGRMIQLEQDGYGASHLSFSPEGQLLATLIRGVLRVKELGTEAPAEVIAKDAESVSLLRFSPDGGSVLLGLESGDIEIWPVHSLGDRGTLRGLGREVEGIAFSPDASWIVVNPESSPWIWRTDGSGSMIEPESQARPARRAAFSPDGRWLLTTADTPIAQLRRWHSPHDLMQALWQVTADCPAPEERIELLGLTPARAKESHDQSRERVRLSAATGKRSSLVTR